MSTAQEIALAKKNPELLLAFQSLLLTNSKSITFEDPATPNHELRMALAIQVIEDTGNRNRFANIFLDDALATPASLTLNHQPFSVTALTLGLPVQITAPGHNFVAGDVTLTQAFGGTVELNEIKHIISSADGDVVSLSTLDGRLLDGTDFSTYTPGTGSIVRTVPSEAQINGAIASLYGNPAFLIRALL